MMQHFVLVRSYVFLPLSALYLIIVEVSPNTRCVIIPAPTLRRDLASPSSELLWMSELPLLADKAAGPRRIWGGGGVVEQAHAVVASVPRTRYATSVNCAKALSKWGRPEPAYRPGMIH